MSCHDIGHGLNNVVESVLELFDEQKIDLAVARKLIAVARESVNYCDGNEEEAIESMRHCRCGSCLKAIADGEKLINLFRYYPSASPENKMINHALNSNNPQLPLATWEICESCFDSQLNEIFGEKANLKAQKKQVSGKTEEYE